MADSHDSEMVLDLGKSHIEWANLWFPVDNSFLFGGACDGSQVGYIFGNVRRMSRVNPLTTGVNQPSL